MAFDAYLRRSLPAHAPYQTRDEGPAFLKVARDLYGFARIDYVALNVPVKAAKSRYMHCWHATDAITHCVIDAVAAPETVASAQLPALKSADGMELRAWTEAAGLEEFHDGVVYALRALHGELAFAAVTWAATDDAAEKRLTAVRDLRLLLNYFHSHLLRINGVDTSRELIMSARELDCLSWTAAGKTAWEASVILGISERTVRFHLNVAREKLNCATTTQAVAKAISHQLIELSA